MKRCPRCGNFSTDTTKICGFCDWPSGDGNCGFIGWIAILLPRILVLGNLALVACDIILAFWPASASRIWLALSGQSLFPGH